ncbi:MAG: hypothetical protein HOK58_04170 [Acidimicrobiaceae bacterium]|nr:hypothetical protein [Acidimicrobiaceae bacterium]
MIASILAVVMAAAVGVALGFFLVGRSDTTSDPTVTSTPVEVDSAVPQTPGSGGPTNSPGSTTAVAEPFDLVAAASVAKQALVRIEAFSCAGVQVATGVVLNDGIIVTRERVLGAPWLVQVIVDGESIRATPQTSDAAPGLAFITIDDAEAFDVPQGVQVAPGDQVAIVGIDGRPALASIVVDPNDADLLQAQVVNAGAGNAIEPVDIIVTDSGGLVGVAQVGSGEIDVLTPDRIQGNGRLVVPDYACRAPLRRDLDPADAESAVSLSMSELLTMQQLSDAYANEQWALVRQIEPGKAALADANFVNGWRPLRQGFVYPVERSVVNGLSRWRIGLIGHETWNGNDLTTLFCLTWTVDPVSGAVVQTNKDNVTVYGSQPGQQQQPGFVDPSELRLSILDNCPL